MSRADAWLEGMLRENIPGPLLDEQLPLEFLEGSCGTEGGELDLLGLGKEWDAQGPWASEIVLDLTLGKLGFGGEVPDLSTLDLGLIDHFEERTEVNVKWKNMDMVNYVRPNGMKKQVQETASANNGSTVLGSAGAIFSHSLKTDGVVSKGHCGIPGVKEEFLKDQRGQILSLLVQDVADVDRRGNKVANLERDDDAGIIFMGNGPVEKSSHLNSPANPMFEVRTISEAQTFSAPPVLPSPQKHQEKAGTRATNKDAFYRLFENDVLVEGEALEYRRKDGSVLKSGRATREGIACTCCSEVFPIAKFEAHCGSNARRASARIFRQDGLSLSQCLTKFSTSEAGRRKSDAAKQKAKDNKSGIAGAAKDGKEGKQRMQNINNEFCRMCGGKGGLLRCGACPAIFHKECIDVKDLPEEDWYCPACRCSVCDGAHFLPEGFGDATMLFCDHCGREYHVGCLRSSGMAHLSELPNGHWYCRDSCKRVLSGLDSAVGRRVQLPGGLFWSVLHCPEHEEVPSMAAATPETASTASKVAAASAAAALPPPPGTAAAGSGEAVPVGAAGVLEAAAAAGIAVAAGGAAVSSVGVSSSASEISAASMASEAADMESRMKQALDVLHECFHPIRDEFTQEDLLDIIVHNRRTAYRDYSGFYTIVLENEKEMITAAAVKVYGNELAEVPLIGTRFKFRRQGMCRTLINAMEQLFGSLGVGKLVLPAVPEALPTWRDAFGFHVMSRQDMRHAVELDILVFPGTQILQRPINLAGTCAADVTSSRRGVKDLPTVAPSSRLGKLMGNQHKQRRKQGLGIIGSKGKVATQVKSVAEATVDVAVRLAGLPWHAADICSLRQEASHDALPWLGSMPEAFSESQQRIPAEGRIGAMVKNGVNHGKGGMHENIVAATGDVQKPRSKNLAKAACGSKHDGEEGEGRMVAGVCGLAFSDAASAPDAAKDCCILLDASHRGTSDGTGSDRSLESQILQREDEKGKASLSGRVARGGGLEMRRYKGQEGMQDAGMSLVASFGDHELWREIDVEVLGADGSTALTARVKTDAGKGFLNDTPNENYLSANIPAAASINLRHGQTGVVSQRWLPGIASWPSTGQVVPLATDGQTQATKHDAAKTRIPTGPEKKKQKTRTSKQDRTKLSPAPLTAAPVGPGPITLSLTPDAAATSHLKLQEQTGSTLQVKEQQLSEAQANQGVSCLTSAECQNEMRGVEKGVHVKEPSERSLRFKRRLEPMNENENLIQGKKVKVRIKLGRTPHSTTSSQSVILSGCSTQVGNKPSQKITCKEALEENDGAKVKEAAEHEHADGVVSNASTEEVQSMPDNGEEIKGELKEWSFAGVVYGSRKGDISGGGVSKEEVSSCSPDPSLEKIRSTQEQVKDSGPETPMESGQEGVLLAASESCILAHVVVHDTEDMPSSKMASTEDLLKGVEGDHQILREARLVQLKVLVPHAGGLEANVGEGSRPAKKVTVESVTPNCQEAQVSTRQAAQSEVSRRVTRSITRGGAVVYKRRKAVIKGELIACPNLIDTSKRVTRSVGHLLMLELD